MMYQRWGDNRSYKTAFNAWEAYKAYKRGMTVYCNCPKKNGVEWWYDSLRHQRLDITIRKFSDWYIHHIRYPPLLKVWYDKDGKYHDWPPAQYVKLGVIHRDSTGSPKWWTYYRPFLEKLHKLYNTEVQIRPSNQAEPNIPLIHKALIAP